MFWIMLKISNPMAFRCGHTCHALAASMAASRPPTIRWHRMHTQTLVSCFSRTQGAGSDHRQRRPAPVTKRELHKAGPPLPSSTKQTPSRQASISTPSGPSSQPRARHQPHPHGQVQQELQQQQQPSFNAAILATLSSLSAARASFCIDGASAAQLQGVQLPGSLLSTITICVQWDHMKALHQQLQQEGGQPTDIISQPRGILQFNIRRADACTVSFYCQRNTVVAADPGRVEISLPAAHQATSASPGASSTSDITTVWVKSLYHLQRHQPELSPHISSHLSALQVKLAQVNSAAWQHEDSYSAWLQRHGPPMEAAAKLAQDPLARLHPLDAHLPALEQGTRVMNLLGSHGSKAVAMALLGAHVTVVDVSPGNARYATELAQHAGVPLRYVVSDVLQLPAQELDGSYDVVLMEMGILHYFLDLAPLMGIVEQLLAPGGRLVLRDFHPVSTKLITSRGKKHKVTGDYFDTGLAVTQVAFSKYGSDADSSQAAGQQQGGGSSSSSSSSSRSDGAQLASSVKGGSMSLAEFSQYDVGELAGCGLVLLRRWTLSEVLAAVAGCGLRLCALAEDSNEFPDHKQLPKTFTLVAAKG